MFIIIKKIKRITAIFLVALMVSLTAGIAAFAANTFLDTSVNVIAPPLQLTVDNNNIDFGDAQAGLRSSNITVIATVISQASNYNVSISGEDFMGVNTNDTIPISSVQYSATTDDGMRTIGDVSTSSTIVFENQPATSSSGKNYTFLLGLVVPYSTTPDQYEGVIILEASTI